jgi:tRNA dimethylallyltransferase
VIAIFGPTGVGKTAAAVALGDRLRERGEDPVAVSADALQVYRGLETLTGAASEEARGRLEHRLLSFLPVTESFSAGQFAALAHAEIDRALDQGRRPVVVGGTGLYLRAALSDLKLRPPPPPDLRARLRDSVEKRGPEELHAELRRRSPRAAETIEPGDRTRVVRALELVEMGEEPPEAGAESELWTATTRHPTILCGLTMEREALYGQIDARVEEMVAAGAGEEARRAVETGPSPTARQALGFEELLAGDVEALKRRTRNYAKRQLTWMRKLRGINVIDVTGRTPEHVGADILGLLGT